MKYIIGIILILGAAVAALIAFGWSSLGTVPSDEDKTRFASSKNFDSSRGVFDNRIPGLYDKLLQRFNWQVYVKSLRGGPDRTPAKKFASVKPDLSSFLKPSDKIKVIWLGHSSLLLNFSGKIILIDPVLGASASPWPFFIRRFQPSPIELEDLPHIDLIVISHDHYDHLDMHVAKFMRDQDTKYIVPLGVGSHLKGWGIDASRITELDWWQSAKQDGLEFTATPAQHSSGRTTSTRNSTLWASWVIRSSAQSLYFSGDSGYDTHFKEIGSKLGPFDIAFVENGQYNTVWHEMHLLPDETIMAFKDLNARTLFPIHWGMFNLSWHTWSEPIVKTQKVAKEQGIRLITPTLGQIIEIDDGHTYESLWEAAF